MKLNGTLINYYFHCKRQCYLFGNRLNLEDTSEIVQIGRAIHEEKNTHDSSEINIENIKLDKLTDEYLTEIKKSDADIQAASWQILLYLKILKITYTLYFTIPIFLLFITISKKQPML